MSDHGLDDEEIERRTAAAEQAAQKGRDREAASLYSKLGEDIQAGHGPFDTRAIDAFEAMARVISGGS
ncbi:hypothetical protein [Kitasatospora sp. MBT66]|uniref:hypothetical protein n=1 Tax=Kitasatospora sp. MBT66 TaxID=1444769 RepID=UPI0005B79ED1|nr:hypothetical protein [Kitasatospora sp. MBT66]